jgi:hypothetical protein
MSPVLFGQIDHWETVIYEDDNWAYLTPTTPVDPSWVSLSFNDNNWLLGPGGFGYGDGDDNTVFVNASSCYQRIEFNIASIDAIESLILNIDYDDGFVAYLNGVEIARENITSNGQPSYNTYANSNHEAQLYQGGTPEGFNLPLDLVVNGTNLLCVQTHNVSFSSSDFSSRVFLSVGILNNSQNYGPVPDWFEAPFLFTSSNLPIVIINTENEQEIPDDPKINGTMGIIYNGEGVRNYLSDSFDEYSGPIGISKRGSSSQGFPKKQWGIETRNNQGEPFDVTVFNMAWDNDWVLYAPYSDKSLIRNVLAYQMGWDMGIYAPRTKLVEVVLNGNYEGVYVFTEKIKRKDGKVGGNDIEIGENTGNDITGDYILKLDKTTSEGVISWYSPFPPYPGAGNTVNFQHHDPAIDELSVFQKTYIKDYITAFESALDGPNFTHPTLGYRPFIDLKSFINFFLVNEISKNVDGYRISSFIHKLRTSEGGVIYAGPLWDFNLAFGNANYCQGWSTEGWQKDFYLACGGKVPFWWNKLVLDTYFTHDLKCHWLQMRQSAWHTDSLMARIDSLANYLEEAQQRNFQRWEIHSTYIWPNEFVGDNYEEDVSFLKNWITSRVLWMDDNMPGDCPDLGVVQEKVTRLQVAPNPSHEHFNFTFGSFVSDGSILIKDLNGKILFLDTKISGKGYLLSLPNMTTGLYHYQVVLDGQVENGKLIIN